MMDEHHRSAFPPTADVTTVGSELVDDRGVEVIHNCHHRHARSQLTTPSEEHMFQVPAVTLNNGVEIPILGFGVYQIEPEGTQAAVEAALAAGYRHIDTAAAYGNEVEVGRAIAASGLARDDLFITTKLWPQQAAPGTVEDATKRAFDTSLSRLGLDYLDLYLIHQPYGDVYAQWRAMTELTRSGATRAIGVSNFYNDRLVDLIRHNDIAPAVNQVETHPFFQRGADQEFMTGRGVAIESWGPFAEGRNDIFANRVLSEVARAHDKSTAQVVLRWLVDRGVIVIPKSVRPERMAENLDIFDFSLTDEQMTAIASLDTAASLFFDHREAGMAEMLGTHEVN
jgi:2,5-diketo-D-gluconate reductase A